MLCGLDCSLCLLVAARCVGGCCVIIVACCLSSDGIYSSLAVCCLTSVTRSLSFVFPDCWLSFDACCRLFLFVVRCVLFV